MRGTDYFQTGGSTDLNGYAEKTFRLRGENEEFILFVEGREDRYASKIINNLKPGSRENYKITGIVSLLRFPPYFLIILFVSLIYIFVFGTWEGMLTPNIYFYAKKIKHN